MNAQVLTNVCDLYGTAQTSSSQNMGSLRCRKWSALNRRSWGFARESQSPPMELSVGIGSVFSGWKTAFLNFLTSSTCALGSLAISPRSVFTEISWRLSSQCYRNWAKNALVQNVANRAIPISYFHLVERVTCSHLGTN